MGLFTWVSTITGWWHRATTAAMANGLSHEILRDAYWLAQQAATEYLGPTADPAKRAQLESAARAFVVARLVARGVPESIARYALEAAVQILKRERRPSSL
ncbi:MAG: hypothetical protein ACREF4_15755 [Gammaproteobacteria bacterium]